MRIKYIRSLNQERSHLRGMRLRIQKKNPGITKVPVIFLKFFLSLFIYAERASEHEQRRGRKKERETERETENPKQAPHCQLRAQRGAGTHKP